jgi:hypothetical protein
MGGSRLTFSTETADALRQMQKIANEQEKFIQKQVAQNERLRSAAKQQRQEAVEGNEATFGSSAVGKLQAYVAGVLTIGTAFRLVTAGVREYAREQREALASLKMFGAGAMPAAAQAATPAEFNAASATAVRLRATTGMPIAAAGALSSTLLGYGRLGDWSVYSKLHGVSDPQQAVLGVEAMRTVGAQGTTEDLLGRLVMAGRTARSADYGQLGTAYAGVMGRAKGTGFGEDQLLAALAVSSRATRSPMTAGEQLGELAQAMGKRRIGGGDLFAGVEELRGRGLSASRLEKMLGSTGAVAFQRLESQLPLARSTASNIRGAPGAGVLDMMQAMISGDPIAGATRRIELATGAADVAEMESVGGAAAMTAERTERTRELAVKQNNTIRALSLRASDYLFGNLETWIINGTRRAQGSGTLAPREQPGDIRVGQ